VICLVTGAAGALGAACLQELSSRGHAVVGTARRDGEGLVAADLADPSSVERLVATVLERHGRLDALVNAAGGYAGGHPLDTTPLGEWHRMRDANLESALLCTRAALAPMRAQDFGRIVNVGSRAAEHPFGGATPYVVAKAGVIALTEAVAAEVSGSGVAINVVLPSTIDTPANRAAMPKADYSKWVSPAEIARAIAWLIEEPTGLINGAVLPVYGRA
jgi:NAD(P)-dependent dehydrogenase (short-subunit alcohol dehydrogenase family)